MPANIAKPNLGDDELQMIWGAAAIGAALNLNTRQAFLQLEAGRVPGARKFGRKWVTIIQAARPAKISKAKVAAAPRAKKATASKERSSGCGKTPASAPNVCR